MHIGEVALAVLLAACAYTDLRWGLIYNSATLPAMALGLALGLIFGGWAGLGWSALALVICGGVFLLPFMVGGIGGGDVKLMAAVGALGGLGFGLRTAFYAVLLGAAWALLMMIRRGKLKEGLAGTGRFVRSMTDRNLALAEPQSLALPAIRFAVFIAAGAACARWFDFLPILGATGR